MYGLLAAVDGLLMVRYGRRDLGDEAEEGDARRRRRRRRRAGRADDEPSPGADLLGGDDGTADLLVHRHRRLLDGLLRPRGLRLRRRRAAHGRRPDRPRAPGRHQHHRSVLGRQRGVAHRGRRRRSSPPSPTGTRPGSPRSTSRWCSCSSASSSGACRSSTGASSPARGGGPRGAGRSPSAACCCRCCSASPSATCSTGCPSTRAASSPGSFLDLLTPLRHLGRPHPAVTDPARTAPVPHHQARPASSTTGRAKLAPPLAWIAVVAVIVFSVWTQVERDHGPIPDPARSRRRPRDRRRRLVGAGRATTAGRSPRPPSRSR